MINLLFTSNTSPSNAVNTSAAAFTDSIEQKASSLLNLSPISGNSICTISPNSH